MPQNYHVEVAGHGGCRLDRNEGPTLAHVLAIKLVVDVLLLLESYVLEGGLLLQILDIVDHAAVASIVGVARASPRTRVIPADGACALISRTSHAICVHRS